MNENYPKNRKLKIVVKAKKLFKEIQKIKNPKDQEKIIDQCTALIEDGGLGSEFGDKNRDFITTIFEGFEMEWSSELSDKTEKDDGYKVVLDSVKQDLKRGESGFFTENPIPAEKGKITGYVSGNISQDGQEEDYTIYFHITKGLETTIILPIDPKLQIRQKT